MTSQYTDFAEASPHYHQPRRGPPLVSDEIDDPRIREILDRVDGGRVLDVGCVQHDPATRHDPNWLHQHLYRVADDVVGVDIDEDGIEDLQDAGYRATVADAESLALEGEFEYVVAGEIIEHVSNPGLFLDAVRERLTDDGQLILSTPNPWCWARLKHLVRSDVVPCNPEHTHYQDEQTLRQLLARHGFEAKISFVGPASPGVTRLLSRLPLRAFQRLGATQLLAVAEYSGV